MDATPAVERDIAIDMVKRGLLVAPAVVARRRPRARLGRRRERGDRARDRVRRTSSLAAVESCRWAAKISNKAAGVAATIGYVVRLAVIVAVLFVLQRTCRGSTSRRSVSRSSAPTSVLLTWEAKHVTLSLAAPGLRPALTSRSAVSGDE